MASSINFISGLLSVLAQILIVWLVLSWLFSWKLPEWIRTRSLLLAFSVALIATLGSLTYSEVLGYEPCKLCWIQRIFMYPQILVLGFAVWKHKGSSALIDTSLVLSVIGVIITLYHYLMQRGLIPEGPCAAIGYSVSCAKVFVMQFGYITIPLMALSAFLLISVLLLLPRWQK